MPPVACAPPGYAPVHSRLNVMSSYHFLQMQLSAEIYVDSFC